ncbi:hypothetical protein JCM8208_000433 [Rhodotorula glutinis]
MDQPLDAPTLAFLSRLPLLLSPRPRLSSTASQRLAAATQGSPRGGIQCRACRAELVGGINASVWVERGELWSACGGCGSVSSRAGDAAGPSTATSATATTGKGPFEPVKKRRRVALQRRDEAVHPTALAASSTSPAVDVAGRGGREGGSTGAVGRAGRAGRDEPTKSRPRALSTTTALPPPSASTATSAAAHPPLPTASSSTRQPAPVLDSPRLPSTASNARSTPSLSIAASPSLTPAPAPPAGPTTPLDAVAKKRKRPKQPSGLAELLEAKKKREQGEKAAGRGLGLAGFLQGL